MKSILVFIVLCMSLQVYGQQGNRFRSDSIPPDFMPVFWEYADVKIEMKVISQQAKTEISVDWGQERTAMTDYRVKDERGKPVKFNSITDALNWMGSDGWEMVGVFVLDGAQHFYFKRPMP